MQQTYTPDQTETIAWARRVATDPGTVYLDTETTGLGSTAEIVDIAVVDARGQTLLDTFVKPHGIIPPDSTRIHGITDEMVEHAMSWEQIAPDMARLLTEARHVVVYNAEFDVRIMDQCNSRCDLPPYRANWQCAMKQYAAFVGTRHQRYGGYRWHKLTDAAESFGHRERVQHRALADTRLCRAVVLGMANVYLPGHR